MTTREKAENYAIGFFLSDYDPRSTFSDIIEVLENKDDEAMASLDIVVWEPFCHDPTDVTARSIVCMVDDLAETFK